MRRAFPLGLILLLSVRALSLDREAFTFTKYDLDVQIEPEQQRLAARGSITLRNESSSSQKNLSLQISSGLTWRSIQASGKPLQFVSQPYVSDIDHTGELSEAIVRLPAEIAPGNSVELTIGYEGVIVLDATRLTRIGTPQEAAIHTDWDQITSLSSAVRGAGNVVWYPVSTESANLSEGNSLFETLGRWKWRERNAEFKVQIRHSEGEERSFLTLICNTTRSLASESDNAIAKSGDDCSRTPLGLEMPSFVLAKYQTLDRPTLRIAYRPEHKPNAEKFAEAADAVTPFVTEWFGAPREKIQIAELFDPGASPFESGKLFLTPLGNTDPKLVQIALVHELTHAAFTSNRPWVYEGLAHFAQAAYREKQESRRAALDFLGLHGSALAAAEKAAANSQGQSPKDSLLSTGVDEFYRSKSAYVWWMLRDMIGEDALKNALANYRPDQDSEAFYVQHLLEAQSKRNLQWFFDDWVYRDRGLADFRVESAYPRQTSEGNYLVTVTVENLGAAGAEVPVIIRFDGGETSERMDVRGKSKGVVRIATPRPPIEVVVNDGSVPESDISNNNSKVQK